MKRRGRWDVESPHILADSFTANENGCRVSRGKNGKCGGSEEAGTRGLEEWRNGEKRVSWVRVRVRFRFRFRVRVRFRGRIRGRIRVRVGFRVRVRVRVRARGPGFW